MRTWRTRPSNLRVREQLQDSPVSLIFLRPNLEEWLLTGFPPGGGPQIQNRLELARALGADVSIEDLRDADPAFDALIEEIIAARD